MLAQWVHHNQWTHCLTGSMPWARACLKKHSRNLPQIVTHILQKAFFKHALEPGPVKRTEPAGHTASKCSCGGIIKPDVVLYEEGLNDRTINESVRAISQAQVLIIGGTSLAVYPAAGLIDYFSGEHLVVINKSPTPRDRYADLLIKEPIGQVFSQIKVKK